MPNVPKIQLITEHIPHRKPRLITDEEADPGPGMKSLRLPPVRKPRYLSIRQFMEIQTNGCCGD